MNVFYPAGTEAKIYKPGDFILTHGDVFYSKLIRVGQRLRYGSAFTFYNHAALIAGEDGTLFEALGDGIDVTHISKYKESDYHLVSIDEYAPEVRDRYRIMAFAKSCVGMNYDWLDIASISISLLTGSKISFQTEGHLICSGFVARCLERSNAIFPKSSQHMMPADLAQFFQVYTRS